jgi:OmpA-OmpF porin, OOP family
VETSNHLKNGAKPKSQTNSNNSKILFMKYLFALLMIMITIGIKAQDFKAYNNYDFIPGEKILFEDNFSSSKDGEFPPRWNLFSGQGVVNTINGQPAFVYTEGSPGTIAKIEPAMKIKTYLSESFTIEFDFIIPSEEQVFELIFKDNTGDESRFLNYDFTGDLSAAYFTSDLKANYPGGADNFQGKWHHAAVAYNNQQIKCYIDQYRELVIPKCDFIPVAVYFGGCEKTSIRNVKIAEGGGMNMLGKILTDGKFVSHAVKFDVGKSIIKGESMGFLNEVSKWLKENSTVKIEIGGYTDSDGDDAANQKLSEQRAEAVKKVLVDSGIEGARLQTKGYGETNPIDSNATPEGKANNRRVEFVKQ